MEKPKVRNVFLLVVSYILKGMSIIMYIATVAMIGLRALAHFFPDFKDPEGVPVKVILEAPEMANLSELFWIFIGPSIVLAYMTGTMGKLVANIARDVIFERKNVRYLRGMTLVTVVMSFLLSREGAWVDGATLFLSLSLFLSSMILSRAITIAEEQEFTI